MLAVGDWTVVKPQFKIHLTDPWYVKADKIFIACLKIFLLQGGKWEVMVEWGSDTVSHDKSSFGNKIGHKNKIRKTK